MGDVKTIAGMEAISGGFSTGSSFSGCLGAISSPPPSWSSCVPTLLSSDSTSNSSSVDVLVAGLSSTTSEVSVFKSLSAVVTG